MNFLSYKSYSRIAFPPTPPTKFKAWQVKYNQCKIQIPFKGSGHYW